MKNIADFEAVRQALQERYPGHDFKWEGRRGLCPEHPDRSPSLYLYKDHAYCFGCNRYFPLKGRGLSEPGIPRLLRAVAEQWQKNLAGEHPEAAKARAWLAEMCGLEPEWLSSGVEVGEEGHRSKLPIGLITESPGELAAHLRHLATDLGLLSEDLTEEKNKPVMEFIRRIADPLHWAWQRTEVGNAVLAFIYEDSPGRVAGFKFRSVGAASNTARFMGGQQPGVFGLGMIDPDLFSHHGAVIVEGESDLLAIQVTALRNKHVFPVIAAGGAGRFRGAWELILKLEPEAQVKIHVWPDADIPPAKVFSQGFQRCIWPYTQAEIEAKADPRDIVLTRAKTEEELTRLVRDSVLTPEALKEQERQERVRAQLQKIKIYTAGELLKEEFPPPRWVIPDLLPTGLTLFGGKPKVGKSWLCLGLGLAVALGGFALGERKVERGEVLYLALEDSPQRLRERLENLLRSQSEGAFSPPPGLHLTNSWPRLDEGGLELLEGFLDNHPGVKFVMIDTLARVRPQSGRERGRREGTLYDEDYQALAGLQTLVQTRGIGALIVHHLRKTEAEDPLDLISGTTGLGAAPDTAWVLKRSRGEADAELFIVGRDVEEQSWALRWDMPTRQWILLGPAEEWAISKERREIIEVLREVDEGLKPKEIAEVVGQPVASVKKLLTKMLLDNQVKKIGYGIYSVEKEEAGGVTPI